MRLTFPIKWLPSLLLLSHSALLVSCKEKSDASAGQAPPPPVVLTQVIQQKDVPVYVEHVAQTEAHQTVEIRARVAGFLLQAPFKEGAFVKKGDLLFQIEPQSYQAAVDQAQANISKAEATLERAQADVTRLRPLVEQRAISQQELDNAIASVKVAEADLVATKAQLTTAELDLSYTEMRAPFDGIIGARMVDIGNYVSANGATTLLATISTTSPMRVSFHISENEYLRYQNRFLGNPDAAIEHNTNSEFQLLLGDNSTYEHQGKFDYADRALDPRTGTLKVVIAFENPDNFLRPGQFARVRSMPELRKNAILVPQKAVLTTQSAKSVRVIGADNKVETRSIEIAQRIDDAFIVESGLTAGERVIVEGLQKAIPGAVVTPKDQASEPVETPEPSQEEASKEEQL